MPLASKKRIIAARTETTQGTAATIVATDYFYAEDVVVEPVVAQNPRHYAKGSFGTRNSVPGELSAKVSFKTELKGSGGAGTAYAPIGSIFKACGMSETVVGGTSVTYAPTSNPATNHFTAGSAMTLHVNYNGLRYQVTGVVGSYKLSLQAGKIVMLEFEGMGVYATPSDVVFPTQTYSTITPVALKGASFATDGYSAIVSKIDVDAGNQVSPRPDVSSPNGIAGFMITERKYTGSIDPEFELQATFNWWSRLQTGTVGSTSFVLGSVAGNIVTFTLPRTQFVGLRHGDRAGVMSNEVSLEFHENAGDDEISIVFT